jgi:hypothetical protein
MTRGMAFFGKLFENMVHAPWGRATSRPYHAVATWLAVPALLGGALMALSASLDDSSLGTLAGCVEQGLSDTAQNGKSLSPQDLVPGQWTWVSGSNQPGQGGVYGMKGVAAPGNIPGARQGAVSWTDFSGNLWLFGGYGTSVSGYLNDLWKWDISSGQWTWVSGSSLKSQAGTYGTKGVAAAENAPGARHHSVSWTDSTGNLWLFGGGFYSSELNDLWKWSIAGGKWTWVSGSNQADQVGTYGTKGTAARENVPGAREKSVSWTDSTGNLWLFGGYAARGMGYLNDLWKWNIASGQWTWVSGSIMTDQAGTYGTKGVPAPANFPGARSTSVSWTDSSGNLWLFGGEGFVASGPEYLNDLWEFNIASGQWTWVSGSNQGRQAGTYGTKGVPAPSNVPGARYQSVSSTDSSENLWLFGGADESGTLNDLWKFNIASGQWTWVSGSNQGGQAGTYGTEGVAAPGNIPGARYRSVSWVDATGNLWLFGGDGNAASGSGDLNDLWVYANPAGGSTSCAPDNNNLCLLGGRFQVAVDWGDYGGGHGQGMAVYLTPDAGYFWFSSASNVEVVAKMVSFCGSGSDNVAVYAGGLTDLDVTLHVTDTRTGTTKDYHNPLGTGFSLVRDGPFGCPAGVTPPLEHSIATAARDRIVETTTWADPGPIVSATCVADPTTICLLNGRFQVRAAYRDYGGNTGTGQAVSLTSDAGTFWFFDAKNVEVVTKMVSFCGGGSNNDAVYSGGLTDVEVTLTVVDTLTGLTKTYINELGTPFQLIRDGPFSCQ